MLNERVSAVARTTQPPTRNQSNFAPIDTFPYQQDFTWSAAWSRCMGKCTWMKYLDVVCFFFWPRFSPIFQLILTVYMSNNSFLTEIAFWHLNVNLMFKRFTLPRIPFLSRLLNEYTMEIIHFINNLTILPWSHYSTSVGPSLVVL